MLSDESIPQREAAALVSKWIPELLVLRRGGQFEALLTELAKQCVAETLRVGDGELELDSRITTAYNILYELQSFGFPNALEKYRWEVESKVPDALRKPLKSAMASVWRRRDPGRSLKEGFESDHYFAGTPSDLHAQLGAYMALPWLQHPSVDWLFLDMMVTRELSAFAEEIKKQWFPGRKDSLGHHAKYWQAKGATEKMAATGLSRLFAPSREFNNPKSPISITMNTWQAMYEVWRLLTGPVLNPSLVREEMTKSKELGARWDVPSWALIDRVINSDRAVWLVGPYSQATV
ncbi:hypothetical protein AB7714_19870 [Tardiphaga sp. 1201_B9_N1_1]|uniref:hypothetical protein n=1 Tax=unclassified Tardiphaga TaxID=2631404 RepID=UPI003F290AA1